MVISTEELKELIDSNGSYVLIDVRRDEEMSYGVVPTSHQVCLDDFQFAWDLSDDEFKEKYGFDKPLKEDLIIVYCRTGSRSGMAASFLRSKGFNVKNYEGSVQEWSKIDDNVEMY